MPVRIPYIVLTKTTTFRKDCKFTSAWSAATQAEKERVWRFLGKELLDEAYQTGVEWVIGEHQKDDTSEPYVMEKAAKKGLGELFGEAGGYLGEDLGEKAAKQWPSNKKKERAKMEARCARECAK
jgi:hypothetical protein